MQSAEPLSPPLRPRSLQWFGLALLVLSIGINYADRVNLGVAASHIQQELHFTDKQLGILLGGFFWTYALFQLVAGKLIDRWNVNWVYAAGFLREAATSRSTGLASIVSTIRALRLLLGVGEAIAYPAYSKILVTM